MVTESNDIFITNIPTGDGIWSALYTFIERQIKTFTRITRLKVLGSSLRNYSACRPRTTVAFLRLLDITHHRRVVDQLDCAKFVFDGVTYYLHLRINPQQCTTSDDLTMNQATTFINDSPTEREVETSQTRFVANEKTLAERELLIKIIQLTIAQTEMVLLK